ncbi:MAG: UDP-N-acetylmuramate--L-alanine ligase [Lachnospiraceae bacterium]|nr:UDP-N-acetylmuramate--L-alanine ligase [Lachnospiraceae bacterium]
MYKINFEEPVHVHFIGIGGISMSGLAEILLKEGFAISGSDASESDLTRHLASLGAKIYHGQRAENLQEEIPAFVVYTAAVKKDNPEYQEAVKQGLPLLSRAELLGQIMSNYPISAGIAGTHGKTTTTSMLSQILMDCGKNPTITVGGILKRIGGNIHVGDSPYFVTEACEYTNSFFSLKPTIGIILNVMADHLDFFKDIDDIRHSFRVYAENISDNGTLIINGSTPELSYFTEGLQCDVITFGLNPAFDYSAANIVYDDFGCPEYDLFIQGKFVSRVKLKITGEHNVVNSLAAVAAALLMDVPMEAVLTGIAAYEGTDRRFQKKGEVNGCTVIDDYAHHPDEIRATLKAAANYPHNRIWCIFQPHTYTRTKAFLKEFAQALALADEVVLAEIYPARETDTLGISSLNLKEELNAIGKNAHYFSTFEEIEKFILENCINGDLLITMGAGDIVNVGEALIDA